MKIGIGYDVHRLTTGRDLILGGVKIPHEAGLLGHSDADVLVHAIEDAILGALALGDIGKLFPDTDPQYKDASSIRMLEEVVALMQKKGYTLGNVDATIMAQRPKLSPYIDAMRANLAAVFSKNIDEVSVKATTTEQMGYEGREEGITAMAVVLLKPVESKKGR